MEPDEKGIDKMSFGERMKSKRKMKGRKSSRRK
jgi:hypothetical protein